MFNPLVGKIPWRRKWQSNLVFLPRESHEQKSLAGYSLQGHKELATTEQLNMQTFPSHLHIQMFASRTRHWDWG